MNRESFFISHLQKCKLTQNIGDDAINLYTKEKSLVISMDSFIENVHFKIKWLDFKTIAKKAFLINISDIIAKNAIPKYALLAISLPNYLKAKNMLEIIDAIKEICSTFNIKLIGGDTTRGENLTFNITLIGILNKKFIPRIGIKNNDLLAHTAPRNANIGNSLKALRLNLKYNLFKKSKTYNENCNEKNIFSRFCQPILRTNFMEKSHRFLHICMDITDGVIAEIMRLQMLNKINFAPFVNMKNDMYKSGEEYELLFSFNKKDFLALKRRAKLCRVRIITLGKFKKKYKRFKMPEIVWH